MKSEGIGDEYQRLTRYARGSLGGGGLRWSPRPSSRKTYKEALKVVELPAPTTVNGPPLWDTIRSRRSVRSYTGRPLSLEEVSQLLWATQGTTETLGDYKLRAAPSAGALYPVETYLVANRVEALEPGLYHYDPPGAALQLLHEGALGARVAAAALDQHMAADAAVVFIWTAVVERSKWKYRERAYRYMYMDAGHIGQNLYLAAGALGLGCCAVGAFYDDEVERLVGIDGVSEVSLYMACIGKL